MSRLRSEQWEDENQQFEGGDRDRHVLLKMGPAFPGATAETEDALEHRDATFDPGAKASQLPVDSTQAHHLANLQPAFLVRRGKALTPSPDRSSER